MAAKKEESNRTVFSPSLSISAAAGALLAAASAK